MAKKRKRKRRGSSSGRQLARDATGLRDLATRDPKRAAALLLRADALPLLTRSERATIAVEVARLLRSQHAFADAQSVAGSVEPPTRESALERALAAFSGGDDADLLRVAASEESLAPVLEPLIAAVAKRAPARAPRGSSPTLRGLYSSARSLFRVAEGQKPSGHVAPELRAGIRLSQDRGSLADLELIARLDRHRTRVVELAEVGYARAKPRALLAGFPYRAQSKRALREAIDVAGQSSPEHTLNELGPEAFVDPGAALLKQAFGLLAVKEWKRAQGVLDKAVGAGANLTECARGHMIATRLGESPRAFARALKKLIQLLRKHTANAPLIAALTLDRAGFYIGGPGNDARAGLTDLKTVRESVAEHDWMGCGDTFLASAHLIEAQREVDRRRPSAAMEHVDAALALGEEPFVMDLAMELMMEAGETERAGQIASKLAKRSTPGSRAGSDVSSAELAGVLVECLAIKGWNRSAIEQAEQLGPEARFAFDIGALTVLEETYFAFWSERPPTARTPDVILWALSLGIETPVGRHFSDLTSETAQGLGIVVEGAASLISPDLGALLLGRLSPHISATEIRNLRKALEKNTNRALQRVDAVHDEVHDALHPAFCISDFMNEQDGDFVGPAPLPRELIELMQEEMGHVPHSILEAGLRELGGELGLGAREIAEMMRDDGRRKKSGQRSKRKKPKARKRK